MKWTRVVLAAVVMAAAACSSPTVPRLPNPDGDDREPTPEKPGVVATLLPAPTSPALVV
jgi:hypothetical protein